PEARRKAIESLDTQAGVEKHIFDLLTASLADPDAGVRRAAITALAATNDERVVDSVLPLMRDQNPEVRQSAATALGRLGQSQVTCVLAAALKDPSSNVRTSVAAALRMLNWRAPSNEEQALFEVALGNTKGAAFHGDAAVQPLVSELEH